jgi:1,4-alpha-glucan branching enzyme
MLPKQFMQNTQNKTEPADRADASALPNRYSAGNNVKPVNFFCVAPDARDVYLMGDFNDWDPVSHPMKRQSDGKWLLQIWLRHGYHHYLFLVDGARVLDPNSHGTARYRNDEKVSLLAVS